MKIESDSAAKHLPPAGGGGAAFASQVKQRAPAVGAAKRHPARASDEKILKAMIARLDQLGVSSDQALGNLQASLQELSHGLNQVFTLRSDSKPDRLATGLPRKTFLDLKAVYHGMNHDSGDGFDKALERALLTKISSFPNGAQIVGSYRKLQNETREAARKAFPNDREKAAAAAAAAMRNRLFFANNPGLAPLPGLPPVGRCSVIIQRSPDESGRVNERVVGLIPIDHAGEEPNPVPLRSDVSESTSNAFYIYQDS
jgi:hypothetical protein